MFKKAFVAVLTTSLLVFSPIPSYAAPSTDAKIALLEAKVAALQSEVDQLKALQTQALFLRNCVSKEKSTNSVKISLKLASCTAAYFKKSREAEAKAKK